MFNIGSQELLIILLIVFLLFGPKHIPEVARVLGKGLGDIQRSLRGVEENIRRAAEDRPEVGRAAPAMRSPLPGRGAVAVGTEADPTEDLPPEGRGDSGLSTGNEVSSPPTDRGGGNA